MNLGDFLDKNATLILEIAPDPVFIITKDGKYWRNRAARDLFPDVESYPFRKRFSGDSHVYKWETADGKKTFSIKVKEIDSVFVHYLEDVTELEESKEQAAKDPLTGLNNRRYMDDIIKRETSRVKRSGGKLSALMIDFDHFKSVNDELGHAVGDKALQELGEIIQKNIRDFDIPFRYGGEEFLIIFPTASSEDASFIAERIRREVEEHTFPCKDNGFKCTISGGICQHSPELDQAEFIDRADKALYQSKKHGRNQITVSSSRR